MREVLHWAIEVFFICAGLWAWRVIYVTLRETFGGK